jgi:hypothetical protein
MKMSKKTRPWDRPSVSMIPNRQGDRSAEPIFTAIGRALSAWEGVQVAVLQFYLALTDNRSQEREDEVQAFIERPNLDIVRKKCLDAVPAALERLMVPLTDGREIKNVINSALSGYHGWGQRRNDLAHCFVTEAASPDYSDPDQPIVMCYSACPSHARLGLWPFGEPKFSYLAADIERFATEFSALDARFENLARRLDQLNATINAREAYTPMIRAVDERRPL